MRRYPFPILAHLIFLDCITDSGFVYPVFALMRTHFARRSLRESRQAIRGNLVAAITAFHVKPRYADGMAALRSQ